AYGPCPPPRHPPPPHPQGHRPGADGEGPRRGRPRRGPRARLPVDADRGAVLRPPRLSRDRPDPGHPAPRDRVPGGPDAALPVIHAPAPEASTAVAGSRMAYRLLPSVASREESADAASISEIRRRACRRALSGHHPGRG